MVTENLAMAEELVHNPSDTDLEGLLNEHGAFASPDELEEFLRNFDGGEVDEAVLQTQGEADVGGEPTTTVH